jgi:hypothetical protein
MPTYPGAATLVWILNWCSEHGKDPVDFYENDFLRHPRAYSLLASFQGWKAEREQKEIERRQEEAKMKTPRSFGH